MTQDLVFDSKLDSAKNLAWWLYLFHGLSVVFSLGLLSFIPLIINYIKRDDALDTFVYSHHNWQIRSFWWYLIWMAVGCALYITLIGIPFAFFVWTVAWLWKAYRLIKGLLDLNDNKAMPPAR
ncbi:DUF4870 family protein [Glaciimonas soli]|uniref:Transmembrane protein n=1 Tax=Glaciimonas soli TaxID=2590999 RepID=A0A843YQT7_9BURK|nr:DUF4870 domain-containing protein [Glaciimonas soli]MQQ99882.1 hypothetical protein [Glaciimonas soli]